MINKQDERGEKSKLRSYFCKKKGCMSGRQTNSFQFWERSKLKVKGRVLKLPVLEQCICSAGKKWVMSKEETGGIWKNIFCKMKACSRGRLYGSFLYEACSKCLALSKRCLLHVKMAFSIYLSLPFPGHYSSCLSLSFKGPSPFTYNLLLCHK